MSLGTENSRWPTAISVLELTFDKQTISGEILQYKIRFVRTKCLNIERGF